MYVEEVDYEDYEDYDDYEMWDVDYDDGNWEKVGD